MNAERTLDKPFPKPRFGPLLILPLLSPAHRGLLSRNHTVPWTLKKQLLEMVALQSVPQPGGLPDSRRGGERSAPPGNRPGNRPHPGLSAIALATAEGVPESLPLKPSLAERFLPKSAPPGRPRSAVKFSLFPLSFSGFGPIRVHPGNPCSKTPPVLARLCARCAIISSPACANHFRPRAI